MTEHMPFSRTLSLLDQHELLDLLIFTQAENLYETDANRWVCDCPAHNDTRQHLTITMNPLSFTCRRGCSLFAICEGFLVAAQVLFPMDWPLIWEQQSDAIERDPERLIEWYKEAIKTGCRLTTEEQHEYRALAMNRARRAV